MVQRDANQQRLGMDTPRKKSRSVKHPFFSLPDELLIAICALATVGIGEEAHDEWMQLMFDHRVSERIMTKWHKEKTYTKSVTHKYVMATRSYVLELCCGAHLQHIDLTGCENLELDLAFLQHCTILEYANFTGCRALTGFEYLRRCQRLETLILRDCAKFSDVHSLVSLQKLHTLDIHGSYDMIRAQLDALCNLVALTYLDVSNIGHPLDMECLLSHKTLPVLKTIKISATNELPDDILITMPKRIAVIRVEQKDYYKANTDATPTVFVCLR
jgi:hypothetical protein